MKSLAFAILIVVGMANLGIGDEQVKCTREGAICLDCKRIGYCEKVGDFIFNLTDVKNCVVDFVCDEWSLQCVRHGTCRFTPFSCPVIQDIIVPDPYSCSGFYSCAEEYAYQCPDGEIYFNGTCKAYDGDKRCNDYPVLCEKAGQTVELDGYKYVCNEETIGCTHTIHPVFVL